MLKRIAWIVALSLVCRPFWAFDLPKAASLPKPTAEIRSFRVQTISLRDVAFLVELAVKNPYPASLAFDGMTLAFTVEGAKVFTAASQGGFTVPAHGEKSNQFTVTLAYAGIIKLVPDYASKEWLTTVMDGSLVIPLPKMIGLPPSITFNYKLTRQIPAIKPQVSLLDFSVKAPSRKEVAEAIAHAGAKADPDRALGVLRDVLAGKKPAVPEIDPATLDVPITVSFTLEVRNEAKGKLSFDKLGYRLFVNGESLVEGASSEILQVSGGTRITISNVFSSAKLSRQIQKVFTERKGGFEVKGSASLVLPAEIAKEPIPLSFDESGEFSLK